jgi:hypothetical protein
MRESAKGMAVDGNLVLVLKEIANNCHPLPELTTIDETGELRKRKFGDNNAEVRKLNLNNEDNNAQYKFDEQLKRCQDTLTRHTANKSSLELCASIVHVFLDCCCEWYVSVVFLAGQVLGNWYA